MSLGTSREATGARAVLDPPLARRGGRERPAEIDRTLNECSRSAVRLGFAHSGRHSGSERRPHRSAQEAGDGAADQALLVLPASPPSVKLARSWVSTVLAEIGRDDLVDAGPARRLRAGHQRPDPLPAAPARCGSCGTVDHPRIEVLDSSPVPPQRAPVAPEPEDVDDHNVTTFGRGLDLVAMMSHRWGSDLAHDGRSKSVWFEPQRGAARGRDAPAPARSSTSTPTSIEGLDQVDDRAGCRSDLLQRAGRGCSASCAATTSRCAASCGCWR